MRTLLPLSLIGFAVWVIRLPRVVVEGRSMVPVLAAGDRLVVAPLPLRQGRLVVLRDPRAAERVLVKRVMAVGSDGVEIRGDNPSASTDSRHFGPVGVGLVIGRPLYRYGPAERAGWVWRA